MAGFETVVRPVIFPNIRPTPKPSLTPEEDPSKGFCVIRGSSAQQVSLSNSTSISTSKSRPSETKRRVDVTRVYQEDDEGNISEDTFVDVEVANKVWMREGSDAAPITKTHFYAPVKEEDNVEILKRDVIRKNESR